ncbi:ABC transporter permease [Acidobacteriota bacterium]
MRRGILREIVDMALDSLRAHKLRSFLTLVGIMIGVLSVIGMVSVMQGLNRSFINNLEEIGTDLISVKKFAPSIVHEELTDEERQRKDLTFEDALAIEKECTLIKAVAVALPARILTPIPIKYHNIKTEESIILGMNANWPHVFKIYTPQAGRFLTPFDIQHRTKTCVLGAEVSEVLFPHTQAVGKEIRIGPAKFTVVGILEKRGSLFDQNQDSVVGIPITTLMKHFPYDFADIEIVTTPNKPGNIPATMDQIVHILRQRRSVPFDKPNDFVILTQDTLINLFNQVTGAIFFVLIAIASISLLVGGIGVMNIMLVSVKERTREIGIRKAIGARSSDIMKQFLIEAIFLTGTGGVTGILLGFAIAFIIQKVTPLPATVTLWSVCLGFSVSVAVGLFFGIFPARKAAQLDPIVSLHYE